LCRSLASYTKPQELHRHRKRLDGFGKGVPQGDSQTLLACRDLLRDEDWFARKTAIDVIGKVALKADEEQLSLLYNHLEDDDIFVREASVDATKAVAQAGDDVAISKLAMRLADEDCFVRTRAVVALGDLGQRGDVETLGLLDEMFDDGFVPLRKKAISSAVRLMPAEENEQRARVVARLKRCCDDSDAGVRNEARDALREVSVN